MYALCVHFVCTLYVCTIYVYALLCVRLVGTLCAYALCVGFNEQSLAAVCSDIRANLPPLGT